MIEYKQILDLPEEYIKAKIADFFAEDIPEQDYTTIGTLFKSINHRLWDLCFCMYGRRRKRSRYFELTAQDVL